MGLALLIIMAAAVMYSVLIGAPGRGGLLIPVNEGPVKKLAPIEAAELQIQESAPPRYMVQVTYGLRNGCIKPAGFTTRRVGRAIEVKVYVEEPSDQKTVCTQVYGTGTHTVDLGTDFQKGEIYRVEVNSQPITFTGQ